MTDNKLTTFNEDTIKQWIEKMMGGHLTASGLENL